MFDLEVHKIMNSVEGPKKLHHQPVRGLDRKKSTVIPDVHRAPANATENKILVVKKHGREMPCSAQDFQYITKKYNISNLTPESPRSLGKTGVMIVFSSPHNQYMLKPQ